MFCIVYIQTHVRCRNFAVGSPSSTKLFAMDVQRCIPLPVIEWLQGNLPSHGLQKAQQCAATSTKVAKELVDMKAQYIAEGQGRRDILSLLGELAHSVT